MVINQTHLIKPAFSQTQSNTSNDLSFSERILQNRGQQTNVQQMIQRQAQNETSCCVSQSICIWVKDERVSEA